MAFDASTRTITSTVCCSSISDAGRGTGACRESQDVPLSFVINGNERPSHEQRADQFNRAFIARLQQCNSAAVITQARAVYLRFLHAGGAISPLPRGVILHRRDPSGGRVVFGLPTLLPDEVFVPAEWLLGQGSGMPRAARNRSRPQPPWPAQKP